MLKKVIFAVLMLTIGNPYILGQNQTTLAKADFATISDQALIVKFTSVDSKASTRAALEIFSRGERMLPHLLKVKGVKTLYSGFCLNDSQGGVGFTTPNEDTSPEDANVDNGYYITTEVAAIFLISAIYYENLSFAQVPYLSGKKQVEGRRYNTPERVDKAWVATEKWYKKLRKKGLEKLRAERENPLKSKGLFFLGTNSMRKRDLSDCGQ